MTDALLLSGISAVLTTVLVGLFLVYARRRALLAIPEARSSHTVPTPVGGGVGILGAVLFLLPFVPFPEDVRPVRPALVEGLGAVPASVWLAAGVLVAGITGFADDRRALPPRPKFLLTLAAALLAAPACLLSGVDLPYAGELPFGLLSLPLTLFWLVGFTNAFNFMDGINGLAGTTLVVSGAGLAAAGVLGGDAGSVGIGALLAGGGAGFLPWNAPRAKIFMGDAGALPLGLLLAAGIARAAGTPALPGDGATSAPGAVLAFPAGVLLVGPYVYDVTLTLIRRKREGKRLGQAHKEHLYQRLARGLGTHHASVLVYFVAEAAVAVLAVGYRDRSDLGRVLSLALPLLTLLPLTPVVFRLEAAGGTAGPPSREGSPAAQGGSGPDR
jgi:UDP-N-acetylmuramyl pentapeptide phosphotransferase/UDP-N-acetylglucosamine-1-phosphate transferase